MFSEHRYSAGLCFLSLPHGCTQAIPLAALGGLSSSAVRCSGLVYAESLSGTAICWSCGSSLVKAKAIVFILILAKYWKMLINKYFNSVKLTWHFHYCTSFFQV